MDLQAAGWQQTQANNEVRLQSCCHDSLQMLRVRCWCYLVLSLVLLILVVRLEDVKTSLPVQRTVQGIIVAPDTETPVPHQLKCNHILLGFSPLNPKLSKNIIVSSLTCTAYSAEEVF